MQYDVVIVGGGPAGLAAAIRLKQCAAHSGHEVSVCVLEKGSEIGAHTLSGAILDCRSLNELIPDWKERGAPIHEEVKRDEFWFMTRHAHFPLPHALLPATLNNSGCYIVRMGHVVKWLGAQAEALGVDVFSGFAATAVLFNDADDTVIGVKTGDMGVRKDGSHAANYQSGVEVHARYTLFAEGARGQLARVLEERFQLRPHPQVYGLGVKELWQVESALHQPGTVVHSFGFPLHREYGGGFIYHQSEGLVAIGYVAGLGYRNPSLSPFEEFQRFKGQRSVARLLRGGKRLAYGARAISAGGWQSIQRLTFKGGALIGDDAGFLNTARIKGNHAAIKSGMLAAEACINALIEGRSGDELTLYPHLFQQSWLAEELHCSRNFKPLMRYGMWLGGLAFAAEQKLSRGLHPFTLQHRSSDHQALNLESKPRRYRKPDGVISFDRPSSVFLSNTNHAEDQPCHLTLKDAQRYREESIARYHAPETHYCPAGVYEIVPGQAGVQINGQNCLHCKACDIKDPGQNIVWTAPQGGEGPLYNGM